MVFIVKYSFIPLKSALHQLFFCNNVFFMPQYGCKFIQLKCIYLSDWLNRVN